MWALHIVVVRGEGLLPGALLLADIGAAVGWLLALLTDEQQRPDAFLCCLTAGALGGWLGDRAGWLAGADPLILAYGVHVAATVLGALILVCLAHDFAALEALPRWLRPPLTPAGGLCGLFLGFATWPSEPPRCQGTHGDGLRLCLTEQALYYEVRIGPLRGTRKLPLPCTVERQTSEPTLTLRSALTPETAITLVRICYPGGIATLVALASQPYAGRTARE